MEIAIITSKEDIAGMNIRDSLLNLFNFIETKEKIDNNPVYELKENNKIKLYTIDIFPIYSENLDKKIEADIFLFASRHSSPSGLKSLTCHPIGNFGEAKLGGKEKTLCISSSNLLKKALNELNNIGSEIKHEVTMEATHHGPLIEKPALFIEIGSNEENWKNKEAADLVAKTIIKILQDKEEFESVFIIGGGHYNYTANKLMLKTNYSVGHICSKHNLENLDESLIKEAMEKTMPKSNFVLLDWKGLGKEKRRIIDILEKNKIKYERSDKFFK